ncbi:MAG: hypothetical protein IJ100_08640 [Lachnospiraceae bacterium]|nr:hypothetical protein [Lachnospiraceae bacterium]
MIRHIVVGLLSVIVLIGGPLYAAYGPSGAARGDAVSSATVIIEQPSGAYVVLINKDRHPNKENLDTWTAFFKGEEIGFLFEDLSCLVADADAAGLELAKSFQSRLPENQMALRTENPTLLFSKAAYGEYDVILMSREAYDAYGAQTAASQPFALKIESEGTDQ